MKKKLFIGLSAIGVAAGFWACGGGTVEPMNADDDFIRAMLNAEEGGLQLSTQIEKAKNQCTEDLECYNEMIKANGRELESSSSEAPVSSSTPVSSVKASSSSFMPFSSIGPIGPGNSSSSSTPPVQSSSSSDTPLTGLGDCHPESETVELDAKTKWKFDMGPSFGGITAITSAQFEWSFPDGTPTSGTVQRSVNSPDVSYSTSGQKTASVKVTLGTSGSETITCSKKLQVNGLPITGCKCSGDNLQPDIAKGESASWILSGCISRANIISYTWTGATADATGDGTEATAAVTTKGQTVSGVSVAVANDDNTVLAILRLFGDEQHGTADAGNARSALDDLQSWAQCVTRCREGTRDLSVGTFSLDNHAAQVEWVLHQLTSLLDGHALLLAQLGQQFGILLAAGVVQRVDDGSLVDVLKSILLGIGLDALGVTNEDDVGHVFSQYAVGSAQSALFFCLRKHDALLVGFRACYDLL